MWHGVAILVQIATTCLCIFISSTCVGIIFPCDKSRNVY